MSREYEFTQDWFSRHIPMWKLYELALPNKGNRNIVEIGCFEGRASVWMAENMFPAGGSLWCTDTFKGSEEHTGIDFNAVRERWVCNAEIAEDKTGVQITLEEWSSYDFLRSAGFLLGAADFIYIDASHKAPDVIRDATMAFELLAPGGIMVLDDYLWGDPRDILHRPKLAIDAFTNIYAEHIDVLHSGMQVAIQKKRSET